MAAAILLTRCLWRVTIVCEGSLDASDWGRAKNLSPQEHGLLATTILKTPSSECGPDQSCSYGIEVSHTVAARLAGGDVLEIAPAGKPCCYGIGGEL